VPIAVRAIPVTSSHDLGDIAEEETGLEVSRRVDRWVVVENRYFASGRVELVAQLSLQDMLKTWLGGLPEPEPDPRGGGPSGLILDARGLDFTPVYAPRIRTSEGEMLFTSGLSAEAAAQVSPVVYVVDAAHEATLRAGDKPSFARVHAVSDGDLIVEGKDAAAIRRVSRSRLGQGRVVVVVDP
jgi:hypothetical protein